VVPERDVDPADLYERERLDFVTLLRSVAPDRLMLDVVATPGWTVRDVLAHVVGITADLNAQQFGDGDGDAWTAAQIARRRARSIDELAAEWDREAPPFEAGLRLFGYGFGAHYLGDLLQHVADVRATLTPDSTLDDEALAVALDFYLESFEETLDERGVGMIEVLVGDERWLLGTGDLVASITAPRFELFRALGGRRTLDEIRGFAWTGDLEAVVGLVSRYPVPTTTLGETP
jgi:uncharacterized protein (TIGR03083 family)